MNEAVSSMYKEKADGIEMQYCRTLDEDKKILLKYNINPDSNFGK